MKKRYTKPVIIFESFSLRTGIAGDCEIDTNLPSNPDGCGYTPEGTNTTIFLTDMQGCKREITEDGNNGICYHVPLGNNNLFNS